MAHLLPALVCAALAASAADFSHPMHLAMGLECASCHASAATSTKAEDNNLPRPQACLGCHADAAIKSPRVTAVAHFNHQLHVKVRTCTGCHHGIESATVTSAANFPAMAECVTCHTTVDIPDSCYQCHAKSMRLEPASHLTDFIDSHSRVRHSAPEKQACEVCHGRSFTCAGCH